MQDYFLGRHGCTKRTFESENRRIFVPKNAENRQPISLVFPVSGSLTFDKPALAANGSEVALSLSANCRAVASRGFVDVSPGRLKDENLADRVKN
ncbi:hypothetical protein CDAR_562961 [Caerostris darwini]|uniref:Uncharacterized protein n=1 Tax=Caerostris darwini TaxID=1538125 RepID=A0AAV4WC64_9ARAC|nr:hypothetical protein CDAR_562961 [Caerostris darwini]